MSDQEAPSRLRNVDHELGAALGDERERRSILSSSRLSVALAAFLLVVVTGLVGLGIGLVSHVFAELGPAIRADPEWKARTDALEREILTTVGIGALLALLASVTFVGWYVRPRVRAIQGAIRRLETTTRDALQAARLKSDFMANVSHELRTPMSGVLGMIELLQGGTMEPKQLRRLKTLRVSAKALMRVLNDVLDFSKIEAGKLALRPRSVTPVELVWEVVELFRAQAELKGLNISMEIDGSPPGFIRVDADRLKQVLSNLVGNALKFTEQGAVRVRLGTSSLGEGRTLLELSVADTGMGIPAASLPKLFDAFSQLDGSLGRRHGGTGLGLAISRQIITMMGGELVVSSSVGKGSVFTVTLACDEDVEEDSISPESARIVPGRERLRLSGRGRVLVAEDSPVNREVMADFLNELACDADFVTNGLEAVEAVGKREYDAILMDCQMPEVDGYEATRRIRSRPAERRVPIVAITAHALEDERVRTRQAGMDAFLSKPVKLDELANLLDRLLPHPLAPALVATRNDRVALDTHVARPPAVVRAFLKHVPGQLAELSQAVQSSDRERAHTVAHQLKGTCLAFGAARMARLSAALEKLPASAPTLCADLIAEFHVVEKAVQGRGTPSTPASPWNH
jgi:signal transduction histidine kinase/DNA-binding response OmpR family regulator